MRLQRKRGLAWSSSSASGFFRRPGQHRRPSRLLVGLKDTWKKEDTTVDTPTKTDETEKYKDEIDELKKEIETLKAEKE